jgi:hypothetical protein
MQNAHVVGKDEIPVGAVAEQAHHGRMLALENLDDVALGSPVGAPAFDSGQHPVSMHGVTEVVGADEQITFDTGHWLVGDHKAIAVTVNDDPARNEIRIAPALWGGAGGFGSLRPRRGLPAGQSIAAAGDFLNLASFPQLLDEMGEKSPTAMLEFHALRNFANAGRGGKRREMRQHLPAIDFGRARLARFDRVTASHQRIRVGWNRLSEIGSSGKIGFLV